MEKIYRNRQIVSIALSVFLSVLFVAIAVNAATTIGTNVDTTGTVNASSTITASSTLQVTGAVTTYGSVTLGDAASDVITITGNASTSQALSVAGNFYVGGYATTTASSGDFNTKGAIFASSTLQATGAVTTYGNVTLGDAASDITTITGNASTSQALSVAGDLYVGGHATTTAASGNIATKGTLTVTATSTIGLGLTLDKPTACVNFYATSTATRGSMVFVTTGATSTYAGTVYWQYGACE